MSAIYICDCCKAKKQIKEIDESGNLVLPEGWVKKHDKKYIIPWHACSIDCAEKVEKRYPVKFDELLQSS